MLYSQRRRGHQGGPFIRTRLTPQRDRSDFQAFATRHTEGVVGINWLNLDAFEIPEPYTLGNSARMLLGIRGPVQFALDGKLSKNFNWGKDRNFAQKSTA